MSEFVPKIPGYDTANAKFIGDLSGALSAQDSIIGQIPTRVTEHRGPMRLIVDEQKELDQFTEQIEAILSIEFTMIANTKVEAYIMKLYAWAEAMLAAKFKKMFKTMVETTKSVSNYYDASSQQKPFWDVFNDMVEGMQMFFDEDGNYNLDFFLNSETYDRVMKIERTPEQEHRFKNILERKKADYFAKKRTRRLSY